MVLKPFNQVLNTDRPSRVSPGEASSWWRSDHRQTDHDNHVSSVCFLVTVQGRVHRALASAFRPAELEVLLCVRRAGRPSVSLPPAVPPTVSLFLPLPPLQLSCARLGVGWLCTRLCYWPVVLPGQVWEFDGSTFTPEHQWYAHWWYSDAFFLFHKFARKCIKF